MKKTVIFIFTILITNLTAIHAADTTISKQTFIYSIKGNDTLKLDKYDDISIEAEKPCIIFVFGGGFFSGERDSEKNSAYMRMLAKDGYVAIAIDYRLGFKNVKKKDVNGKKDMINLFENTLSMAVEDLYDATNYVYNHTSKWNINKDMIIANGSSAGAIIVLQAEYYISNNVTLAKKLPANFNYAGVVAFAGAIYSNSGKLKWENPPCPMQLFHGDSDNVVPFGKINIFRYHFSGSEFIVGQLHKMKSPYYFYVMENASHEVATKPMQENLTEINEFVNDYIIKNKPLTITINTNTIGKPAMNKKQKLKDFIKANTPKNETNTDEHIIDYKSVDNLLARVP